MLPCGPADRGKSWGIIAVGKDLSHELLVEVGKSGNSTTLAFTASRLTERAEIFLPPYLLLLTLATTVPSMWPTFSAAARVRAR